MPANTAPVDPIIAALLAANATPTSQAYNIFAPLGIGNATPFGQWLSGQVGNYFNQYIGLQDPNLGFDEFLKGLNPLAQFQSLAPQQRGERPGLFAPQVQYRAPRVDFGRSSGFF